MNEEITEKEAEEMLRQFKESSANIPAFFTNVVKSDDTTKTGNLTIDELGMPKLPLRTFKELSVFCKDIAGEKEFSEYFSKMGEIQTATSLSKEGFLMRLVVTQKKELADVTPQRKVNRGWFKKKEERQPMR